MRTDVADNGTRDMLNVLFKHQRKIMHEAFKRNALRSYAERMNPMIEAGIEDWSDGDGQRLAFRCYKELTLDIAASIFVGADLGP